MKIERFEPKDMQQLIDLYKELVPFDCKIEAFHNNYEKIKDDPNYYIVVAKEDDTILGTAMAVCCIALDTNFLVIENVIVKENQRGTGIGKKIFEELDRFALEKKCDYSLLVSSGFRKEAHQFYERVGFDDDVRGFRKYYNK